MTAGLVLKIFLAILPTLLAFMNKKQGMVSKSEVDFGVTTKYFIFQVLSFACNDWQLWQLCMTKQADSSHATASNLHHACTDCDIEEMPICMGWRTASRPVSLDAVHAGHKRNCVCLASGTCTASLLGSIGQMSQACCLSKCYFTVPIFHLSSEMYDLVGHQCLPGIFHCWQPFHPV